MRQTLGAKSSKSLVKISSKATLPSTALPSNFSKIENKKKVTKFRFTISPETKVNEKAIK